MRALVFLIALAAALSVAGTEALAHKMKLFATAEAAVVSGRVYFSPGGQALDAQVTATTPDGATVFVGRTDQQGAFHFEVLRRVDHRLTADGGDGHEASFTIKATELPASLPADPTSSSASVPPPTPSSDPPPAIAAVTAPAEPATADLAALIEQSVARQVRPLREQLDSYQEAVRWHDVLGGIGYIIGLAGLAYGFASRSSSRTRRSIVAGDKKAAQ
uniref:Cobalt ABC transporter permease n=1 Tax=Rhodopseudomonas palustris (strain BisA53) TaxID=316055 RepID=Q07Q71_RHOP5